LSSELRLLEEELDELFSSSELRLWDEEHDEDNEDEDSFENLEEVAAIDPSAIVDSFLGTDLERSRIVHKLVQSLLQTYQMAS
jgi:hypothetical protein